jgi:hypothetical protein
MPGLTTGCRVDYTFNSPLGGWVETWYSNQADTLAVMNQAQQLAPSRGQLLGAYSYIVSVKVTLLSQLQTTKTFYFQQNPFNPELLAGDVITDTPWDSILCRVGANDGTYWYHRTMWLRGVPDFWISFDVSGNPVYQPAMYNAINAFLKQMNQPNSLQCFLSVRDKSPGTNATLPVTGVSIGAGTPPMIVLTIPGQNYVVGQYIRIFKCRGNNLQQAKPGRKGVNGIWQVVAQSGSSVTIGLPYSYLPGIPVLRVNGSAKTLKYKAVPVSSISALRFGSRITGRAKTPMRGAKRKKLPTI